MGRNVSYRGRNVFRGCETSPRGGGRGGGAKRLKLGQVVTATGAKRLEDGCETSWGGGGTYMVRNVLEPIQKVLSSRLQHHVITLY